MDVKTQGLDRVIEAVSAVLAAEMDRVIQETRDALEQEFQARIQVIREAEAAAAAAAHADFERAIEQSKDETRRLVTAELDQHFSERLEAASVDLKNEAAAERAALESEMNQLKDEWFAEHSRLQEEIERWRIFATTQQQLAEASSQPEMLTRFLRLAQSFAEGLALYVAKPDGLVLWRSRGGGAFPAVISQETADPAFYFRPISVRGVRVGAICAVPSFQPDALEFVSASLERAIEAFGLRLRAPAPKAAAS